MFLLQFAPSVDGEKTETRRWVEVDIPSGETETTVVPLIQKRKTGAVVEVNHPCAL